MMDIKQDEIDEFDSIRDFHIYLSTLLFDRLTVGVTRWWVGRDNATLTEPN